MSGNQKQPATGGPQTQRYSTPYQPILPQQPTNRSDAFSVTNPGSYVSQAQGPNQGPGLRGIPPAGPPNQSSTPPNVDLKVQNLSGPIPQMQFVQGPVRSTQQQFYQPRGAAGPPSQTQRMPNQQHRPQAQAQMFPSSPAQYVTIPQMYLHANAMPYYNTQTQRPPGLITQYPGTQQITYGTYFPPASQTVPSYPQMYYGQPPAIMTRTPVAQPTATPPAAAPGNMQAPPLVTQVGQSHNIFPRNNHKQRRPNAISIIDPKTGQDKLNEIFDESSSSHPASGESSARQTPQPAQPNPSKEVQAAFAKQVAQAISAGERRDVPEEQPSLLHEPSPPDHFQAPPQPVQPLQSGAYDVQSSTLHYNAKEFVSLSKTAIETTPIVSANSDAAEVIIPKKDRESPVKGRKQGQRDHKPEAPKETPTKENNCDQNTSIDKEDISQMVVLQNLPETNALPPTLQEELIPPSSKELTKEIGDKRGQKKHIAAEVKVPENNECVLQPPPEVTATNAKSKVSQRNPKQNVNQTSQSAKQQPPQHQAPPPQQPPPPQQSPPQLPQQQQPPLPVIVPTPQPPKPSSRSNKTKELNMKGANKEGTDMDAFNDNGSKDEINANVLPDSTNDVINANLTTPQTETLAPAAVPPPQTETKVINSTSDHKKIDDNDNVTIKIEPLHDVNNMTQIVNTAAPPPIICKPSKQLFDVTSIIKETPKTIIPPFSSLNEPRDEPDKAALSNDKMVMVKNDVNAKVSNENSINDTKPKLPYGPDQWAPDKPLGKKVYARDFLLALKNLPASQIKPGNIPDVVQVDERNRPIDGRLSMGGRTDFTNPPFPNYGGKSGSQRGMVPKRNSQSGKMGNNRGSDKGGKPTAKVSISLRGDVKLHEVENAWKPTRFLKGEELPEDLSKTELLYKKVRSVLNKLTPQKFSTLVDQVRQLQIDTKERLQGVIDLVFDKAIDEPSFSVAYAMMCKEIQSMQVAIGGSGEEKKAIAFRTLLVTRCQMEFEKQSVDETERNSKLKEIAACTDPEKKKELEFELQEYDRRLRMKSVGVIRFIGELFKQQMLTATIMKRCLQTLLDNKDEESLECLCKLLTTVGKELESKGIELSSIFDEMKSITAGKRQKVSSRIRFMLKDVIELKDSKWIPRRGDSNPKTIDQIQKEAENEQFNQAMNMNTPRKDDRNNIGPRQGGPRPKVSEDGWSSVGSRNRQQPFSIQTDKIRIKVPQADEPLGSSQMFGTWGKGSGGSKNPHASTSNNMYAALEHIDTDRRPMNQRSNKDPYSSKGPSMERNTYKPSYDNRGSRSGSQHRDNNTPMRGGPPSNAPMMQPAPVPSKPLFTPQPLPAASVPKLTEEQIERRIHNSLDEYLNGCLSANEYFQDIAATVPQSDYSKVVFESYNYVTEKSQPVRLKTGELFGILVKSGKLSLDHFCGGFEELLGVSEDLVIDIPQIWTYLAEDIVHLLYQEALSLNRLHKSFEGLISNGYAKKVLKPLFSLVISEKGPNFLQTIWQKSGLQLSKFMPIEDVATFVQENNVELLVGGAPPVGQSPLTYDEIQNKVSEFLKTRTFDDIVKWISANVGDRVKENLFIRALATAIFESSISKNKLVSEILTGHVKLIQKYVDNNTNYELQCLYALQSLVHKLEHPQGLLLSICDKLYEDSTFCQESFIAWENSKDPAEQEGKGVALKQLTSFFTQLKENDEDDYGSSSNSEDA